MALLPRFDDPFANDAEFQASLLPAAPQRGGILAMLANPAVRQMLMGASQGLLEAGAPSLTPKGTGFGAALGAGITGANKGYQKYEEQLAKQAADSLRQRIEERRLALEEQQASQGKSASFGKWAGVGFNPESGKYEIVQLSDTGEKVWSGVEADPKMQYLDTGSGFQPVNTRTMQPAGSVIPKELPPEKQPENIAAGAQASAEGQARGAVVGDKETTAAKAPQAAQILKELESSLRDLPESPAGMKWENMKAYWNLGDEKIQDAAGRASFYSGRMIEFVQKLPGASTDREFPVFMASAGIAADESIPAARRIAAAREARKYFERITNRAQTGSNPPSKNKDLRAKYGL